jgi:predicted nucleotidyltransferase
MIGDRLYRASAAERDRVVDRLAAALGSDPTVAFAYLFGSIAEGDPFHDVDVAVYLRDAPREGGTDHALELADQLSGSIHLPVDVRIVNDAPVTFLYHVLRGRLLASRDDDLLAQVFERTVCRYLDMAPLLRRATKEAFGP